MKDEEFKQKGLKMILDVTCGSRQIWFNKKEPHTIYCDRRKEEYIVETSNGGTKKIIINPDVVADFTSLPFEDNTFNLVIFDPPHAKQINENSLLYKEYTDLRGDWHTMLKKGFEECMRVLKVNGTLIFKWSDVHYSTREVINTIGTEPLFGHRSGKKMNTHWLCFMKFATKE